MEIVKKTDTYTIVKKRSGRFGVKDARGKWINANDKVKILIDEKLIKVAVAKPAPAQEEEAPAEEATSEE